MQRSISGVQVTQSAITQAAQRLAANGRPLAAHVAGLQVQVQQAPFGHHDDTGWRIGTQNAWVGAFRSTDTVVFHANLRHTNVELREGLGQNFAGILVSDRFSSYDSRFLAEVRQQKCLAHLIRNADEVAAGEQRRPGRGELYGQRVAQVFRDGIRLHRDVTTEMCTREQYAQQGESLTLRLNALLNRASLKSKANERLRLGILKQDVLDRLWRFLKDPDIPPTNNAAERSLRTVAMARKVSQCSKNAVGAQTYMRIKSTLETARLRGQDPVAVLTSLIR